MGNELDALGIASIEALERDIDSDEVQEIAKNSLVAGVS